MSLLSMSKAQELRELETSINDLLEHANKIAEEAELSFEIRLPQGGTHIVDWTSSWSDSYD